MTADPPHRARAAPAASLSGRPQWRLLQQHIGGSGDRHLRDLFAEKPSRKTRA